VCSWNSWYCHVIVHKNTVLIYVEYFMIPHISKWRSVVYTSEIYTANILVYWTFICPCIASISLKYNQQDAKFSRSIYFYKLLYMFRRFLRPSSGAQNCTHSVRYCQTNIAACCSRGWDGTWVPSHPREQQAAVRWNSISISLTRAAGSSIFLAIPDAVCTVLCSWWWAGEPPETCRAIYRNK